MKLVFESDLLLPPVSNAISILTDGAKVCIDDIHYDEANGIINVYMQTKDLTGFQKSFLGEMQPVYRQNRIKSLLTIRHVLEMNIKVDDRLTADCNSCFTLLFGVKVDNNELYLGSVEEISGKTLCQIFIKVKELSIDYSDEVNN